MDGTASECVGGGNEGLSGLDCGVAAGPLPDAEGLVIDDAAGTIVDDYAAPVSLFVNGGSLTRCTSSSEPRGRLPNDCRGRTGCFPPRLFSVDSLRGRSGPAGVALDCAFAVVGWMR